MSDVNYSTQKPQVGETTINIPLTFGYKGGRGQNKKGKIIAGIALVAVVVLILYIRISGDYEWWNKLLWVFGVLFIAQLIARFPILEEHKFQRTYSDLLRDDLVVGEKDFWGIYEIEDTAPYFVSFTNGKRGLFVKLERDVIMGMEEQDEFNHYEAIGDALQQLHRSGISIAMLDTMESIGADDALEENIQRAGNCSNEYIKDALLDIFYNLRDFAQEKYTSVDTFVFAYRGKDTIFLKLVEAFCKSIMEANYKSYRFMSKEEIRDEVVNLYNLTDFSVNEAIENLYGINNTNISAVRILEKEFYGGNIEKKAKSRAEIRAEEERNKKLSSARSQIALEAKESKERKKRVAKEQKRRKKAQKKGKTQQAPVGTPEHLFTSSLDDFGEELDIFGK